MKNILITGGAGFIGSSLADKLLSEDKNIICIDNFSDYYDISLKEKNILQASRTPAYKLYRADIEDKDTLEKIFRENKIDAIIHLAARAGVRPSIEAPIDYVKTNIVGTVNILDLMKKYNIPTAAYENFDDPEKALEYLRTEARFPIVLKADGLALGKGVLICKDLKEAEDGVKEIMEDKKFGNAGNTMVIEEFMTGREVSVLSFVDGKTIRTMTSAQDHKRAQDGDQGLNTGGMGTFSPSPFYTEEVDEFCRKYVYQPTVDAMAAEGRPFKGIIFFGLMLTPDGPKVLEYNARFGDPEAQVVLPRMKNDIIEVMEACVNGTLDQIDLQFEDNAAVCVVLASDGYPVKYEKGIPMYGFENFKGKDGYYCFHAGTKLKDGQIVTNGGRVLGITATGKDLKEARKNAYEATEWITFANKYMRHDIGKAIDEA